MADLQALYYLKRYGRAAWARLLKSLLPRGVLWRFRALPDNAVSGGLLTTIDNTDTLSVPSPDEPTPTDWERWNTFRLRIDAQTVYAENSIGSETGEIIHSRALIPESGNSLDASRYFSAFLTAQPADPWIRTYGSGFTFRDFGGTNALEITGGYGNHAISASGSIPIVGDFDISIGMIVDGQVAGTTESPGMIVNISGDWYKIVWDTLNGNIRWRDQSNVLNTVASPYSLNLQMGMRVARVGNIVTAYHSSGYTGIWTPFATTVVDARNVNSVYLGMQPNHGIFRVDFKGGSGLPHGNDFSVFRIQRPYVDYDFYFKDILIAQAGVGIAAYSMNKMSDVYALRNVTGAEIEIVDDPFGGGGKCAKIAAGSSAIPDFYAALDSGLDRSAGEITFDVKIALTPQDIIERWRTANETRFSVLSAFPTRGYISQVLPYAGPYGEYENYVLSTQVSSIIVGNAVQTILNTWSKFLNALAEELYRIDDFIINLINNTIPGIATDLLTDWETILGLPDECTPAGSTLPQRQAAAHTAYTGDSFGNLINARTGIEEKFTLNKKYYEDLAASLGVSVLIIEHDDLRSFVFRVDFARVDTTPPVGIDGSRVWSWSWLQAFTILANPNDDNYDTYRCSVEKAKPAHTKINWIDANALSPTGIETAEIFGEILLTNIFTWLVYDDFVGGTFQTWWNTAFKGAWNLSIKSGRYVAQNSTGGWYQLTPAGTAMTGDFSFYITFYQRSYPISGDGDVKIRLYVPGETDVEASEVNLTLYDQKVHWNWDAAEQSTAGKTFIRIKLERVGSTIWAYLWDDIATVWVRTDTWSKPSGAITYGGDWFARIKGDSGNNGFDLLAINSALAGA